MSNEIHLRNAFISALGIREEEISDDLGYKQIAEWDSISHMILIAELEDRFGVSLTPEAILQFQTYGSARKILSELGISFGT